MEVLVSLFNPFVIPTRKAFLPTGLYIVNAFPNHLSFGLGISRRCGDIQGNESHSYPVLVCRAMYTSIQYGYWTCWSRLWLHARRAQFHGASNV